MINENDPLKDFSPRERVRIQMMKNRLMGENLRNRVERSDLQEEQRRLEHARELFNRGKINEGPIPQSEHPFYRTRWRRFMPTFLDIMNMYRNLEDWTDTGRKTARIAQQTVVAAYDKPKHYQELLAYQSFVAIRGIQAPRRK